MLVPFPLLGRVLGVSLLATRSWVSPTLRILTALGYITRPPL